MPSASPRISLQLLVATVSIVAQVCSAETGKLVVQAQDAQHRPVNGLEVGIEGIGGSGVTGSDGKAMLALGGATKQGEWVSLYVVHSPQGKDLVMVSPWDNRTIVPSFADGAENFVRLVLIQRGDKAALESGAVLATLVAKIDKENTTKSSNKSQAVEDPKAALNAIGKQYGFDPDELDKLIRAWGAKTVDPYEAGLAALYARNYPQASNQLDVSLKLREDKVAADQKAMEADQKALADAAFFLGSSLYGQGKYKESADAYRKRLKLTPDDPIVLNNLALSLSEAGDYAGAEPLYRRALSIDENVLAHDNPAVAAHLNNLALLLKTKGDYAAAEPLYRRALAIDQKALGPDHPEVARDLDNVAELLRAKGDYADAEPLYGRALAIDEKALGPDHPDVAIKLDNLAGLLYAKRGYAAAEPLYRRALAIDEKALGPDHPHVARDLNDMAALLCAKKDYADAEPLYRRALAIDEKALGPDHPNVATTLNNLGALLEDQGNYAGAEPLMRRALAIDEKGLGPDHPNFARDLNNLAELLRAKADYAGAESLYRRALAIDEKALGPDHPTTKQIRANLNDMMQTAAKRKEK